MAEPLIVGIHGLANKPQESVLTQWWRQAITEGLNKNENTPASSLAVEMVYWANQMYSAPLHTKSDFADDVLFNDEPYVEATPGTLILRKDRIWDEWISAGSDLIGTSLEKFKEQFGINSLADRLLGILLKDLNHYYQDAAKRDALRTTLRETLLANRDKKIMLIAHSMGSIIAYDVLTLLGQTHRDFAIDHFVTIGSPLGLAHVKGKIIQEYTHRGEERKRLRTPSVVKNSWVNYADRKDPVALDTHLGRDYGPNATDVIVEDDLVYNDYRIRKNNSSEPDRNYHKSYGYLRTPEISALIKNFLT